MCSPCLSRQSTQPAPLPTLGRTIQVPLDYKTPGLGKAPLYFELGAPFDKAKPTVFIISDGQQFYVTRGAIANLQKGIFGGDFNVVGIVGRGFSQDFTRVALDVSGHPDWSKAWQVFNSEQWVEDIESVREAVVRKTGKIFLYGASGGATLAHEYLLKYGSHVARAYTESAADPILSRELGISIDPFWEEIGVDPSLRPALLNVLRQHASDRTTILMALQRQHFFVSADNLPTARAELIHALDNGDMNYLERVRKEYQVDAILGLFNSQTGMPISVRELEFIYPTGAFDKLREDSVYPYIESEYVFLKPLVDLVKAGKLPAPGFKISSAHRINSEVFILAGRWDEAVDYRTSIALAYSYPSHHLFIADDNHVFAKLNASGLHTRLIQTFLKYGLNSFQLKDSLRAADSYRWKEP
jgi:pimeloyl-ACP methyl ester carboxylesterase